MRDRLAARRAERDRQESAHRRIARTRLAVFAAGIALAWLAFDRAALSPWWLALPIAAFAGLVSLHLRAGDALERARIAVRLYEDALARLEDRWAGRGATGEAFREASHPYAEDLDVLGHGSLFERLSSARTSAGERTLARWLLAGAPPAEVRERQAAVAELAPRLDFREELAIAAAGTAAAIDTERLTRWGAAAADGPQRGAAIAAGAASLLTLAAGLAGLLADAGTSPLILAVLVQVAIEASQRGRIAAALAGIERAERDLVRLARLVERLEREPTASPRLRALAAALASDGQPASQAIHGLRRRIELLDSGRNFMFAPIALWLSWRLHLARSIGLWRHRHGPHVAGWIAAVGELEALASLAGYAWECPEAAVPEIAEEGGPSFSAEGLGHPLLPAERCVPNDVALGAAVRALVVSGSNMSGKSTLLRAIGANAVLAYAGAPVRARRLRLSPMAIGAVLRVNDSLLDGSSRFHAELVHLRRILDLAAAGPVLFLLDEILHGTNSHDRRIGAEAIVRGFLARGAIGLVTTHDLALAELAAPGSGIENVHFVDHLEGGAMRFDYRMHPGVVRKSNALELMRAVGIDV